MPNAKTTQKPKSNGLKAQLAGKVARDQSFARPSATAPKLVEPIRAGDEARWIDESLLLDNPFQTRTFYDVEHLNKVRKSFEEEGQIQAAMGRPHPDPELAAQGYIQLAFGHTRRELVRNGANAGAMQPNPQQYRGQLFVVVRPNISDKKMLKLALDENDLQNNISVLDRAKSYIQAQLLVTESLIEQDIIKRAAEGEEQKLAPWRTVAAEYGRNFQDMSRVARTLDLAPEILSHFGANPPQGFAFNVRHARAFLDLMEEPRVMSDAQKVLLKDVLETQMDGAAAERRAKGLTPESAKPKGKSAGGQTQGVGHDQSASARSQGENSSNGAASGSTSNTSSGITTSRSTAGTSAASTSAPNDAGTRDFKEFSEHARTALQELGYLNSIDDGLEITAVERGQVTTFWKSVYDLAAQRKETQ